MLLRVSDSNYNGSLHYPHPTLLLFGRGIDFKSPLRIRIVQLDGDLYNIYYNHLSSMNIGGSKSVLRHSRRSYSRRCVYKKRLSMKRRCRRSRGRGRGRGRRTRKN